jgi:Activator of Hsp90 ATPase homolog 1-like protein
MNPSERKTTMFDVAADRLLDSDPGVDRGRMFNADGLKIGGKFFAFPKHDEIVLKLPAERVEDLLTSGAGSPFDAGKGRPMREWVTVRPESAEDCAEYMVEARNFLAPGGYEGSAVARAPRERVFDAVGTLEGVRGWWTRLASGSAERGGELLFQFEGLDETIRMHVDVAQRPATVHWTCHEHTMHPEWVGTRLVFNFVDLGPDETELRFRHIGLVPQLECYGVCSRGWDFFLPSIVAWVEQGEGTPYGSDYP